MQESFRDYMMAQAGITAEQWELIVSLIQEKTVPKGTILLRQGDICSEVYFVTTGLLRSYTVDDSGKEHILQFSAENWWIADRNSFYYGEPSLFFVDVIEDARITILDHDFETRIQEIAPSYTRFNTRALHNAIRFMQRRINLLLSAGAEERYLDFISLYPNVTLRVPQWMIASYLGITPESLSRVRRELARRNFKPH